MLRSGALHDGVCSGLRMSNFDSYQRQQMAEKAGQTHQCVDPLQEEKTG